VVEKDIVITPQELVAGLLWEITYFGGTEEMAEENRKRIFQYQGVVMDNTSKKTLTN